MFFWNSFVFSMIQQMLAIWSLVPLPFLSPVWTSGSSGFMNHRPGLKNFEDYIWKFMVHILLKPGLEDFEHYFTSVWDECNCPVVSAFFGIAFLWDWNEKTDLFQSCDHCWVFHICWDTEYSTFIESSFRIWNSSDGILSPTLALVVVMLP